jgi:hypothetical protein
VSVRIRRCFLPENHVGPHDFEASTYASLPGECRATDGLATPGKPLLITGRAEPAEAPRMVEICRSFSYKLNMSKYGLDYESRDFFCSEKATCTADQAAAVSADIHEFCIQQVMQAVVKYHEDMTAKAAKRRA